MIQGTSRKHGWNMPQPQPGFNIEIGIDPQRLADFRRREKGRSRLYRLRFLTKEKNCAPKTASGRKKRVGFNPVDHQFPAVWIIRNSTGCHNLYIQP